MVIVDISLVWVCDLAGMTGVSDKLPPLESQASLTQLRGLGQSFCQTRTIGWRFGRLPVAVSY